jgi:hypothetical protein
VSASDPRPGTGTGPGPADRPTFEEEIRDALHHEKVLALRGLAAIALVAAIAVLRFYFFG